MSAKTIYAMNGLLRPILGLSIIACFVLLGLSLGEARDPMAPGRSFQNFSEIMGWVLFLTSACAAVTVLVQRYIDTSQPTSFMVLVCGLAMVRIGPQIAHFHEWMVVAGCYSCIWVLQFFDSPRANSVAYAGAEGEPQGTATSQGIQYRAVKPRHTFDSVVGMHEVKERLLMAGTEVVDGQKRGQGARNGIMLFGEPGNGKTMIAEALAGTLKLPFISVSYGDVASEYINKTTQNVVKVFRDAVQQAPCLLFIDEIDSLIQTRSARSSYEEAGRTANTILTELVAIRKMGVVVVAATNFLDRLDSAAIREGRFDFKVEITPPDADARAYLIASKACGRIAQDVVQTAVRRWEGFSAARISAIVDEACRGQCAGYIGFQDLQAALRRIQGRKGVSTEHAPALDQLVMSASMRTRLNGIAGRMQNIMEIEELGGTVPRGVLFYGPPGTGKTVTASALAKSADWSFLTVSGMDLLSDQNRIDSLLEEASDLRPCVVFIDEADDVLGDRRYSNTAPVTNKLLAAMDGAKGKTPDILFIAATNHPEALDSAALRGGRFTEKVAFELPSNEVVEEFVSRWIEKGKRSYSVEPTVKQLVRILAGLSIANVREVLQGAVNNAIGHVPSGNGPLLITLGDAMEAKEAIVGDAML